MCIHQECTVCDQKCNENTIIDKLSHDQKFVAAKSCTFLEDGYVEYFRCKGCGQYYLSENEKLVRKLRHRKELLRNYGIL